jgi:hypothetical protein
MSFLHESGLFLKAILNGGLFTVAFLFFAAFHWVVLIKNLCKAKTSSPVPFVGGVCGMLAVLVSGLPEARHLWWIPYLLDPASVWLVVETLVRTFLNRSKK